jgi:hypothetical protein
MARHWDLWESAAARLVLGDRYCSSPYWGLSAVQAFHGRAELAVYSEDGAVGVFQEWDLEGGRLVIPCDVMWYLGSPILAEDATDFLGRLCDTWKRDGRVHQVTVSGLFEEHPIWRSPTWVTYPHWEPACAGRQVASLEGGVDGFMSRRSANFRSRLRRAVKAAQGRGIEVEYWPQGPDASDAVSLLDRAMKIEANSWKGLAGMGINRGQMYAFYRCMLPLLAERGRLRGLFLTLDGRDLSYLFGASFAGYFRGLQFSYLESETESLGNVGQWMMIQRLVDEGCESYDLGQAMAYKCRWAETSIPSRGVTFQLSPR